MPEVQDRQTDLLIDLGGEQVDLVRLEASESLGQPFAVQLDIRSALSEIDLLPHLGKPAVVQLDEDGTLLRYFHGMVIDGRFLHQDAEGAFHYQLNLAPAAYFHERGRNFRIFQNMPVRDILTKVFEDCGIAFTLERLAGGTRIRSYCVQYGESDFGFASRLMEEEGIYYFYDHRADAHVLTLCDEPSSHRHGDALTLTFNHQAAQIFNVDSTQRFDRDGDQSHVHKWVERVSTGGEAEVRSRDFDFMKSNVAVEATASAAKQHPEDQVEVYAWPGRYYTKAEGEALNNALLLSRRANRRVYEGESGQAALSCGIHFTLEDHPLDRMNASYLVTSCQHSVMAEQYRSTGEGGDATTVRFTAVPADTVWKAPQTARRPVVAGPETAIVTGPSAETIHVDKFGRIKVHFHWDRLNPMDDTSSCWVRVSQTGGLGNIIIPRVGHEVLVDFINGDPDRPIVVGRVFNDSHMPVYDLPEHKTRALWRTERYREPGSYPQTKPLDIKPTGANELRFEDEGGKEEVFLYAERDMNTRVRFCETHHVGSNQTVDVGNNREIKVECDEKITIGKKQTTLVRGDEERTVKQKRSTVIGPEDKLHVKGNIKTSAGDSIQITAETEIVLRIGQSSITMKPGSIEIKTMELKMSGMAQAKLTSAMTEVSASGVLTARGGLVKIN